MSSIEKQLLEFSLKIFKVLSNEKNFVLSPVSLSTCLSMAFMGTRSECADEMAGCLFGNTIAANEYESLAAELRSLADKYLSGDTNALICTNLMYTDSEFTVLQTYQQLLHKYFSAIAKTLDFKRPESLDVINADIKSATKGKIEKILDQMDDQTAVILANVLYFKGLWKRKFSKEKTQTDTFTTTGNRELNVQMMYQKAKYPFGYSKQLMARIVELGYDNSNATMFVVLPDEESSLAQMKDKLTIQSLHDIVASMRTIEVDLYLPKFKIESSLELIPPLKRLGMKGIFDPNLADFSGLTDKSGLFVSKVIQKAVIEVTEEGTEAAAVTAAVMSLCAMPFTQTFKANHPFLYLLATKGDDKRINSIVFMGECYNPNE